MARRTRVEDGIWGGSWSIRKLDSVEEYLKAYLQAMKNSQERYGWELVYIDAFCGKGSQQIDVDTGQVDFEGKEASGFVVGSTMRALAATEGAQRRGGEGFRRFAFLDLNKGSLDELKEDVDRKHPGLSNRCSYILGDTNETLPELLGDIDWRRTRGVIFIDPYGVSFDKHLLEQVAATYALDVWLLFPLSAIGRMMAVESQGIMAGWNEKLDSFFGSHDWYDTLYHEEAQASLFGGEDVRASRQEGYDELLDYVTDWLRGIFGDRNVLAPLRLCRKGGAPLFALFAAISSRSDAAVGLWRRMAKHVLENPRTHEGRP